MTDLNTGIFHILKFKRMGDMFLGLERHNYFGELSASMGNATQSGIPWEENKLEIKPSHLLQIKTTIGSIVWSKKNSWLPSSAGHWRMVLEVIFPVAMQSKQLQLLGSLAECQQRVLGKSNILLIANDGRWFQKKATIKTGTGIV